MKKNSGYDRNTHALVFGYLIERGHWRILLWLYGFLATLLSLMLLTIFL